MAPKQQGTLKLPKSILEQIGDSLQEKGSGRGRRGGRPQTRKESRKAERAGKKALRNGPPPQKRQRVSNTYSSEIDDESEADEVSPRFVRWVSPQGDGEATESEQPKSILKQTKKGDPKPSKDRARSITPPPKISRSVKNKLAEDDDEIAELEKKLGLKGKKNLPQSFKDDGLDELLEGLGEYGEEEAVHEKRKRKTDADEWLDEKRRNANRQIAAVEEADEEDENSEALYDEDRFTEDSELDDLELGDDGDDGSMDEGDDFGGFSEDEEEDAPAPRVRENPYVAPLTSNPAAKYIPPSLRKPASSDSEALVRLRRQLQGLVNKLTETNLISILGEIEKVYRDNPRQHVTSTLVDLLLISICEPTSLPDTLIILPAGFIAAIYKIIGTDFGAQIIQRITELFDEHYSQAMAAVQDGPAASKIDSSKETSNLVMLLSELYIFQVVGSNLLYDYIRLFLVKLSELNAELLLKLIRAAGPQLRQDDPSSLKDIVTMLRPAVVQAGGEENLSVRTKFMIETIDDLKNNKMRAGGQASAVTSEHTIRMKKVLGTLNTRSIKGSEPLRISLDDIRNSDKKGKWWLIGASWTGNAAQPGDEKSSAESQNRRKKTDVEDGGTTDLFQLAKEHRMNTDIRRAIFVAIMSAEDYTDAYLRLMKLKLKKVQEYEIPKVLIHCAGAEKTYNPYYTLISQKVCNDKKLRTSFQFCLWDLFKQMGENDEADGGNAEEDNALDMRHIVNLAKMFGHLLAENALGVDFLKNLNLSILQPKTKTFLEVLFVTAMLQTQKHCVKGKRNRQAIVNLFYRANGNVALARGLQYFVKKTVRKSDIAAGKGEEKTIKWACEIAGDTLDGLVNQDQVRK